MYALLSLVSSLLLWLKRDLSMLTMDFGEPNRDFTETDTAVRPDAAVSVGQCSRICELLQP